ncbi:hypothetical protein G9A89_007391 [Geosiphon pyriformis]|nr:hypothetical protein G9A89_007391 [Geosiphon pyriformis]
MLIVPSHIKTIHIYRSFLRIAQNWPKDYLRPRSQIKEAIQQRVTQSFRKNKLAQDPEILNTLFQEAEQELKALGRLMANEYKNKYPLSQRMYTPSHNSQYYSVLAATLDQKAAKAGKLQTE